MVDKKKTWESCWLKLASLNSITYQTVVVVVVLVVVVVVVVVVVGGEERRTCCKRGNSMIAPHHHQSNLEKVDIKQIKETKIKACKDEKKKH